MSCRILLVDDDEFFTEQVAALLAPEGYSISREHNSAQVIKLLSENEYDLVLLDIQMPPPDGLTLLKEILTRELPSEVVMFSGAASLQQAADSVKLGAGDFLEKPPDINRLLSVVRNSCEKYRLKRENRRMKEDRLKKYEIIGQSNAIKRLKSEIRHIAESDSRVLIQGETGTGKELVACQIHYLSHRSSGPLVKLNCAAIPAELAEAELFGYKKGAFTGAYRDKAGKFALADGGSLILDEIAELPPNLQSKLLRVLETSELEIIGGTESYKIDVRLIAISGADLESLVAQNRFRADLFYRVNTIPVNIPPLRERKSDLPLLFEHFFDGLRESSGRFERSYDPGLISLLSAHDWPGNVRELKNFAERLFFLCHEEKIGAEKASSLLTNSDDFALLPVDETDEKNLLMTTLRQFERNFLKLNYDRAGGNISELARKLGMDRGNLYKKLKNHDLL
jgi:two-component system nitrogen regulation response regulator NtrX